MHLSPSAEICALEKAQVHKTSILNMLQMSHGKRNEATDCSLTRKILRGSSIQLFYVTTNAVTNFFIESRRCLRSRQHVCCAATAYCIVLYIVLDCFFVFYCLNCNILLPIKLKFPPPTQHPIWLFACHSSVLQ